MIDVMFDLETMGTSTTAAIIAIGAVRFDFDSGKISDEFYVNVNLQSSIDAGLTVDGDTVMWWLKQSPNARKRLTDPAPAPLANALYEFNGFIAGFGASVGTVRLWSHATFDEPILSNAYRAIGIAPPWKHKQARDVRTILDMGNPTEAPARTTEHDALEDARAQAMAVMAAWGKDV